jgi:hypothetical protein
MINKFEDAEKAIDEALASDDLAKAKTVLTELKTFVAARLKKYKAKAGVDDSSAAVQLAMDQGRPFKPFDAAAFKKPAPLALPVT